jgi:hypothetical protein
VAQGRATHSDAFSAPRKKSGARHCRHWRHCLRRAKARETAGPVQGDLERTKRCHAIGISLPMEMVNWCSSASPGHERRSPAAMLPSGGSRTCKNKCAFQRPLTLARGREVPLHGDTEIVRVDDGDSLSGPGAAVWAPRIKSQYRFLGLIHARSRHSHGTARSKVAHRQARMTWKYASMNDSA